jgi:hypothetical protein
MMIMIIIIIIISLHRLAYCKEWSCRKRCTCSCVMNQYKCMNPYCRLQSVLQYNSKNLRLSGRLLISWWSSSGFLHLLVHESERRFENTYCLDFRATESGLRGCCIWEAKIVLVSRGIRRESGQSGTAIYSRRVLLDTAFYRGFPQPFRKMLRYYLKTGNDRQSPDPSVFTICSIINSYITYSVDLAFFKVAHPRCASQSINSLNTCVYVMQQHHQ